MTQWKYDYSGNISDKTRQVADVAIRVLEEMAAMDCDSLESAIGIAAREAAKLDGQEWNYEAFAQPVFDRCNFYLE